jgi:hypothetical protein
MILKSTNRLALAGNEQRDDEMEQETLYEKHKKRLAQKGVKALAWA